MDWILDSIIQASLTLVTKALDMISTMFLENFGIDFAKFDSSGKAEGIFDQYFPLAHDMQTLIMAVAIGIICSIFIYQLLKNFLGPLSDAEHPVSLIGRVTLCVIGTWFSYDILAYIQVPIDSVYDMFMDIDPNTTFHIAIGDYSLVTESLNADMIAVPLMQLIFSIAIGWNFIRLLLEIVERYIILGVMYYTAPMAFSTMTSANTKSIFQSWIKMLGSQYILMFMNVFFLKVFISGMNNSPTAYQNTWEFFIWNLCMLGLLKVGQRIDQHMASLGLSTAQAGGGIASTLGAVAMTMGYLGKDISRSSGKSMGASAMNGPGSGKAMPTSALQYKSPGGALTDLNAKAVMNQNASNAGATTIAGASAAKTAMDYFGIKPTGTENLAKCSFGAGQAHLEYMDGSAIDIRAADGTNSHKPQPGVIAAEAKGADGFQYYMSGRGNPGMLSNAFGGSAVESHLEKICGAKDSNMSYSPIMENGINTGAYEVSDSSTGKVLQYSPAAMYDTTGINTTTENYGGYEWNVADITPTSFHNTPTNFNDTTGNISTFESYFPGATQSFGNVQNAWYEQDTGAWSVSTDKGTYNVYDNVTYSAPDNAISLTSNDAQGYFAVGQGTEPEMRSGGVVGNRNIQMDENSSLWQKTKYTGTDDIYKFTRGRKK